MDGTIARRGERNKNKDFDQAIAGCGCAAPAPGIIYSHMQTQDAKLRRDMTDFECPFCRKLQVRTDDNSSDGDVKFHLGDSKFGELMFRVKAIRCLSPDCGEIAIDAGLHIVKPTGSPGHWRVERPLHRWNLLPRSSSKPQPDYVPQAIRQDYYEACLIKDLSPKASATLIRRCLQGMIRDFCKIRKDRLIDEDQRAS
jgi:hypothetical protein